MKKIILVLAIVSVFPVFAGAQLLNEPESIIFDSSHNRYLVSNFGEGRIVEIDSTGQQSFFKSGLGNCAGLEIFDGVLYIACGTYGLKGVNLDTGELVVDLTIPGMEMLNGVSADNSGNLYVTDWYPEGCKIYKVQTSDYSYSTFFEGDFSNTNGICCDDENGRVLAVSLNYLISIDLENSNLIEALEIEMPGDGLTMDGDGHLYYSSWVSDAIYRFAGGQLVNPPQMVSDGHVNPADISFDIYNNVIAVPNLNGYSVEFVQCIPTGNYAMENILLDDENENCILDADETVNLILTLSNIWNAQGVSATLFCDDDAIMIQNSDCYLGDILVGEVADNSANPFVISIASDFEPHTVELAILVTTEDGYEDILYFDLFVGIGHILLIDDDEGDDFESYYISVLQSHCIPQHWNNSLYGEPNDALLGNYSTIIWFTGNGEENTLTEENQQLLSNFLDNGGNLFVSGQNIGDDIHQSGFYENYLHAVHVQDDWNGSQLIKGIDGDPIGDGLMFQISGGDGASNQSSPGVINPTEDASKVFGYMPQLNGNGVRYDGDYKVVYFAFGFEAVAAEETRMEIINRILQYFNFTGIDDINFSHIPKQLTLHQNYPNPFNPSTTIAFTILQDGAHLQGGLHLTLNIYEITGKLIKTLVDSKMEQGYHSVVWNGKDDAGHDVASGVYFYRIDAGSYRETKSMLLLK